MKNTTSQNTKVAVVNRIMPLYRLGVLHELSVYNDGLEFTLFGNTDSHKGIKTIDWEYSNLNIKNGLRWIKTKLFFYKPEGLLWQTGIVKRIMFSDFKVFVFEGALNHLPQWYFAVLCRIFNKKAIFWSHGLKGLDNGIKKAIRIFFFRDLPHGMMVYGNHQKNIMLKNGFVEDKLQVVFNSLPCDDQMALLETLDHAEIDRKKAKLFEKPENFTIIFIGRLVSTKKVDDVLKAIKLLSDENIMVNCIVIGDGPEKENLLTYQINNKLEGQVSFIGPLYEESKIVQYFAMADLMVSPGNVGLNCIHSLAYGVPVITHSNFKYQGPEVEAIIEGETGSFYAHEDFNDMVLKLKSWILNHSNKQDNVQKCQKVIKEVYNPENHAQQIANGVKKALKE